MSKSSFILFVSDAAWIVGCAKSAEEVVVQETTTESASPALASQIEAVLCRLRELDHHGEPIVLAIPSAWCLCASVSTDGLPRKQRRQSMLYRLEEKLPLSAEQVTAQFIPGSPQSLGIATETSRISLIVEALESRGIVVQIIVPTALLMLQREQSSSDSSIRILLAVEENYINLFEFAGRHLQAWRLLPHEVKAVQRDVQVIAHQRTSEEVPILRVKAIGLSTSMIQALGNCSNVELTHQSASTLLEDAVHMAAQLLNSRVAPLIDLRCDGLAANDPHRLIRKPLQAAMMAAAVLLVSIILAFHWRTQQYLIETGRSEHNQHELYRQTFPGGQTPTNPRMRLESELRALRGRKGDTSELPVQTSALAQLHRALVRLPSEIRYRVLDIRIDGTRLMLEGQARTHSDAEAVANALRQQRAFKVDPPRTEQMRDEKGVAFTISAAVIDDTSVVPVQAKRDN